MKSGKYPINAIRLPRQKATYRIQCVSPDYSGSLLRGTLEFNVTNLRSLFRCPPRILTGLLLLLSTPHIVDPPIFFGISQLATTSCKFMSTHTHAGTHARRHARRHAHSRHRQARKQAGTHAGTHAGTQARTHAGTQQACHTYEHKGALYYVRRYSNTELGPAGCN